MGRTLVGEIYGLPDHILGQIWADDDYYLVVLPKVGSIVYGRVYAVSPDELAVLDKYEGESYTRKSCQVQSHKHTINTWVYIPKC